MSPSTLTWNDEAKVLDKVISAWCQEGSTSDSRPIDRAANVRESFPPFPGSLSEPIRNCSNSNQSNEEWFEAPGFLSAHPVEVENPTLYPVVRFSIRRRQGNLEVAVRIAAFYLIAVNKVAADGWRFEMPDSGHVATDKFHHFPHVQRISGWKPGDKLGFSPPGTTNESVSGELVDSVTGFNEKRPAFPLPCSSAAGVVIAVMASLYGANKTNRILENYVNKPKWLKEEITAILRSGS